MNILMIVIVLFAAVFAEEFSYEGCKLYRIYPSGQHELKTLAGLEGAQGLDFWSPLRRDGHPVDVMVYSTYKNNFLKILNKNNIKYELLIGNLETFLFEERMRQLFSPGIGKGNVTFTRYHRHDEINAYLNRLAKEYSNLVSVENIGKSYEGRDLTLIKISTNSSAGRPVIFIDAGIHAREWIAPSAALYIINQLLENKENANLLDRVDWHVLPVVNPDGYEFTHSSILRRFWRKTRSQYGEVCVGADANRNFDFHWADVGSSNDECSEVFHGKKPFSESEALTVANYILRNQQTIKLYLTFHSFGQLILYPWGYTSELPQNNDELLSLGLSVAKSIQAVAGTTYKVGSSTNVLYEAAGGSDDYAKGVAGVELAYTIELPGGGLLGFDLPPWKILPVVKETWEGMKTFHNYIAKKFS